MNGAVVIRGAGWLMMLVVCWVGAAASGGERTLELSLGDGSGWALRGGEARNEAADGEIRTVCYTAVGLGGQTRDKGDMGRSDATAPNGEPGFLR